MRTLLGYAIAITAAAVLSAPSAAAAPTRQQGGSAEAFWTTIKRIDAHTQIRTIWYVGVYPGSEGTVSDIYRDVARCTRSDHRWRCRTVSYQFGYRRNLSSRAFGMDRRRLSRAHLDARYTLEKYDSHATRSASRGAATSSPTGLAWASSPTTAARTSTTSAAPPSTAPATGVTETAGPAAQSMARASEQPTTRPWRATDQRTSNTPADSGGVTLLRCRAAQG
jgi:hypothetical protein